MLVYLKGIRKSDLKNITDFLYDREAFVSQQDLNAFLEAAQDLKLKGLQHAKDNIHTDEQNKINVTDTRFIQGLSESARK